LQTDFKRNEIYDVCFIGSDANCPKRVNWLARLNSRYNIKIAGKVAGINTRHAYGPKMSEIYLQSKIAIDIIRARALDLNFQTSDRIFKAMGNGCFYLVYPILSMIILSMIYAENWITGWIRNRKISGRKLPWLAKLKY
jgi:hypothetical protein